MKTLKVRLTFTELLLGTWPANQNVAREYIASKGPDAATIEDEVAALGADAAADKAMTVFPRNEAGQPILYDYQVKGFFKDSCGMLGRIGGKDEKGKKKAVNESGKLTAYKKIIDGLIFVGPRKERRSNGAARTCGDTRGNGVAARRAAAMGTARQWQRYSSELQSVDSTESFYKRSVTL